MCLKLFVVSFQTLLVLLRIASNFLIVLDRKRQKEHVLLSKFSYMGAPEQNVQKVQEKLPQRTDNGALEHTQKWIARMLFCIDYGYL